MLRSVSSRKSCLVFTISIYLLCTSPALSADNQSARSTENRFKPVVMTEDHSQALVAAVRAGLKNVTVLHIDAHDDLWPDISAKKVSQASELVARKDFKALDKAGRYFTPTDEALYGINNFLVLAHRLGIVKEVFWAIPSIEAPDRKILEGLHRFLTTRGKPFGNTKGTDLTVDPPYLTGTISGVPVTIGHLGGFISSGKPLWLDIDLDYFPELYTTPVKNTYTGLLAGFTNHLVSINIEPALTTISYSQNGGYLPLSTRFIGPWLEQLLANPTLLKTQPPEAWLQKEEAWYQEFFYQFENAVPIYEEMIKKEPDNPDWPYAFGINLLGSGHDDRAIKSLTRAASIDPAYQTGFLDAASYLGNRSDYKTQKKVLDHAEAVAPDNPLIIDALATYYHNNGNYAMAEKYYRKVIKLQAASAVTYTYLGDSLLFGGKIKEAVSAYKQALRMARGTPDTELLPETWLQLGIAHETLGQMDKARKTYQDYLTYYAGSQTETTRLIRQRLKMLQKK